MTDIEDTLHFAQENELCVIPIKHKDKRPRVAWKEYRERRSTPEEIEEWFAQDSNVALVCGIVSGGDGKAFVVIDFDDPEVFEAFYPEGTPNTRAVKTSKGYHVYFFTPDPIPKTRIEIEKDGKTTGIDVQGEGGYVIAPPSIHPSGVAYEWLNDKPIRFLKNESPSHFRAYLLQRIDGVCAERGWKRRGAGKHDIKRIIQGVKSGERNISAYLLVSYYKQLVKSQAETEDLLEQWNERCEPPLPYTEIMSVVASAFKSDAKTGFDFGLEDKPYESMFFTEKGKPKVKEISEDIKSRHTFVCLKDTEELYRYNPRRGSYEPNGEMMIKSECKSNFGTVINQYWIREILAYIQATTYVDRKELNSQPNLLHLQNGIFNIETYEFRPFTPEIMSTVSLPIEYDPKAKCPVFEKFLSEVAQPKDIQLVRELFGYCLHRGYEIQKFFLFVGRGANGKTTLLELLTDFLGHENVSNVPLQALETNRFSSSHMYGKLANIYADLSAKAMNNTGVFKMATGGDSMLAEKKFKEGFSFKNYAKLIFSCNEAPAIGEDNLALWRRFILIRFENIFKNGVNKNPLMLQKLTTKEELSGIFNVAVDAHINLMERGYFDYDTDIDEIRSKYTRMSNSLKAFIEERVVHDYDASTTKDEFYMAYREWVMKQGLKLQSKNLVGRRVPEYTSATSGKPGGGNRKECWVGIRVMDDNEEKSERRIEKY